MRVGIDARKIEDFGIGRYIRGLLGGLAEIGGDDQYVVFAPVNARPLIPARFEHVLLDAPLYSARELFVVARAAERAKLDLLHAPHYVTPFTRLPIVVTVHDLIHLRHRNPLARLYARTMIGSTIRRSVRVLTVSEATKNDIVARFPRAASKMAVTPNGIDDVFRVSAPVASHGHYFLFVGNDKPHKNVTSLIEALRIVRETRPDVSLVLAGGAFAQFHDREAVVCAGFVSNDELRSLYRNAVALVQPSNEEGFGLPALEAMASGIPVITSTAPALVEITGDAALHANAMSPRDLAAAMLGVVNDEALRAALSRRGIERSREFTWRRCAELTRAQYLFALRAR